MDTNQLRHQGKMVVDEMAEYYDNLDNIAPMATVKPGNLYSLIPHAVPDEPESLEAIQRDFKDKIMPGITHWQSPNFYGWYPVNNSVPSIIGEMYTAMLNIVPFSWMTSPAATELETIVTDALGKLLGLSERFLALPSRKIKRLGGGVLQSGASDSLLAIVVAARERAISCRTDSVEGKEKDDAIIGVRNKLVAYCSDQTHSSVEKSTKIIGCIVRIVPTIEGDFRLTKESLALAVEQDIAKGLIPFFVGSSFGTTNTATVDDLQGVADVCEQHQIWMHVDGAYGGAALA
ncbi:hypothetical protein GGI04_003094, partial [Coemansia thaxteri]